MTIVTISTRISYRIKILIIAAIILSLIIFGFVNNNSGLFVMAAILFFITLFGLIPFKQSRATLTNNALIIETLSLTNKVLQREDIQLSDIEYVHHEEENYDNQMMFYYAFSELIFPSEGNKLIVRLKDGSLREYIFYGAAEDVKDMLKQMPNTEYYNT